ncbi:uncharacterized protein SAMN04488571_1106 [Methanoculleus thermophilus]|jgi:uncharacterized protein|uniref:Uncharacterized protein n=2 Tax=Methanomicrobiaceae TaxID=2194 RepID=A0A1G9BME8_9EURY|nr:uncharacterized protein SAMN04488571_1106 [Methanoculleus thermophilus]
MKSFEPIAAAQGLLAREIPGTIRVRSTGDHRAPSEVDLAHHAELERLLDAVKKPGFEDVMAAPEGYREGGADSWKR